jgi:hypothetical protein
MVVNYGGFCNPRKCRVGITVVIYSNIVLLQIPQVAITYLVLLTRLLELVSNCKNPFVFVIETSCKVVRICVPGQGPSLSSLVDYVQVGWGLPNLR